MMERTVRISGLDWAVIYCENGQLPDTDWGDCLYPNHPDGPAIRILKSATERTRFGTLCHELIHASGHQMFDPDEDWVVATERTIVDELWKAGARWPRMLVRPRRILRKDIPAALTTRLTNLFRRASNNSLCVTWCRRAARDMARAMLSLGVKWKQ